MPKLISLMIIVGLLGALPALAGQRICANQPDSDRAVVELPAKKDNYLYIKGDPVGRFLARFESTCRKGHIYREVGKETEKIFLGSCFQPSKMFITARMGCLTVEIKSERMTQRRH